MSSYPIVLKDEFYIITFSCPPALATFDSALAPGPMKAGRDGLVYQRAYAKSRFSQDTLAEYAGYAVDGAPLFSTVRIDHSFYRLASTKQLAHYAEQVPEHFPSVQKSGKRSLSRPLRIFPATESKP